MGTPSKVVKKAKFLMKHEGKSQSQAFGMAYGMEREGRLTSKGEYIRKKKKG